MCLMFWIAVRINEEIWVYVLILVPIFHYQHKIMVEYGS